MRFLDFPDSLEAVSGDWRSIPDIRVSNIARREIYRPPVEPGFVCWAILWKEQSGALKLSFTEATGDPAIWPPVMDFNAHDINYYLKTLVSEDAGETWTDTGWRENLDRLWEFNSDHHIRHVFELPDGTLVRNYCHCIEGVTAKMPRSLYDKNKEGASTHTFTRTSPIYDLNTKFGSIWTSDSGGRTWKETHIFDAVPSFFIQGIHPLRDGTIFALGGIMNIISLDHADEKLAFSESKDGGRSWSEPRVLLEEDDVLNPQDMGDESDFVELADGSLFVISRTAKGCFHQILIRRDADGEWRATPPEINHRMVHSGYPYMHRASDGTIFFYSHTSLVYSCDEGESWGNLPFGQAYYGQMTELSPGRMLCAVQRNIGDQPFPWRHDTSMRQTTFDYERVEVPRQFDTQAVGALAALRVGKQADFHLALEVQLSAASGIAYNVTESGYSFVALTMTVTRARLEEGAARVPQNVFVQIGEVDADTTRIHRKVCIGKAFEGSWVEFQLSREIDLMKAACSLSLADVWDATYHCFRDERKAAGTLALFTNKSAGGFRNVRFEPAALSVRENWLRPTDWMSTDPTYVSFTNTPLK